MKIESVEDNLTEKIYDDIHGFVYLTKDEKALLESPYMQRLHYIRQNGLAYMIFPGANHTRFSHSIGVLFIAEKMIQQLKKTKKLEIRPIDHQVIRLAALLHDVGHYPLSHTMEASYEEFDFINNYKSPEKRNNDYIKNIKDILKNGQFKKISSFLGNMEHTEENFHHEKIGKEIIKTTVLKDKVQRILSKYKQKSSIDYVSLIGEIITGELSQSYSIMSDNEKGKYYILSQIIKSDLDADQLDYMCRDTHNTGIEASIRLNFIIDNINICKKIVKTNPHKVLCFNFKALQSIEQFIISKFYWYTEILFYEKAYVLNLIAQRLNLFMLFQDRGKKYCNKYNSIDTFNNLIQNETEYFFFNDMFFWTKIKEIINSKDITLNNIKNLANVLLTKKTPKLLTENELQQLNINIHYGSWYGEENISKKEKIKIDKRLVGNPTLLPIYLDRDILKSEKDETVNYLDDKKINILSCDRAKICKKICNKYTNCGSINDIGKQTIIGLFRKKAKNTYKNKGIRKNMFFDFKKILYFK